MPFVESGRVGLASSADGRRVVWCHDRRVTVVDLAERTRVADAELDLDAPVELALSATTPERMLAVHAENGTTLIRVFAMSELRVLLDARIKGEAQLAAMTGSVALLMVGTEELIAVDLTDLRTAPLPVRGAIQIVTDLPDGQILIGARGKLEAWSLTERRPTYRLSLPLPGDVAFGGTAADGRMLWFASATPSGTISLFRLSDGKPLSRTDVGGTLKALVGDPLSTTAVAAIEASNGSPVQLVALDLATDSKRALTIAGPIASFCLAGAPADALVIARDSGDPVLLPLASAKPAAQPIIERGALSAGTTSRSTANASDTDEAADNANDLGERLAQWRAQLHAAMTTTPPRKPASGASSLFSGEPQSRSRAELYAWGISARARTTTTPPPPPQGFRLNELVARFKLDTRARSLLALLYSAWLDGDGRTGLPVGVIARVLGNDEEAWIEALAQGRLGRMGWIRSRFGRTRLRPTIGHFLDEVPARVVLVESDEEPDIGLEPPETPARLQLVEDVSFDDQLRAVARGVGGPVASIDVSALPAARHERVLAEQLFEARLHGALPVLVPATGSAFDSAVVEGPMLVALRYPVAAPWDRLPIWPPPPAPEARNADASQTPNEPVAQDTERPS